MELSSLRCYLAQQILHDPLIVPQCKLTVRAQGSKYVQQEIENSVDFPAFPLGQLLKKQFSLGSHSTVLIHQTFGNLAHMATRLPEGMAQHDHATE